MLIREATLSDAKALGTFATDGWLAAFAHTVDEDPTEFLNRTRSETYFKTAIRDHLILLAVHDKKIAGFAEVGPVKLPVEHATADDREIMKLYVGSAFQGQGIGTMLLDAIFCHPQHQSVRNYYLDVWEKNDGAQKLYARHGFAVIGERRYDIGYTRELIMERKPAAR